MKFLVLALCVCAASAATFPAYKPYGSPVVPVVTAPVAAAEAVYNTAFAAAKSVKSTWEAGKDSVAAVVRQDSDVKPDGFQYVYETQNGISAQATGTLKNNGDVNFVAFQGGYRYTAPDGTPVEITYTADENGYQPQGNLPVGPPIPEAILRSIAYNAAHSKVSENKY